MVTELSRYNLGVAFFKTLISVEVISHQFSDNRWILVARTHCLLFSVKFDL